MITSDKDEIAVGKVVTDKIQINTSEVGNTILHVVGKDGNTADINVSTISFRGSWRIVESSSIPLIALVEADDTDFASVLSNEVLLDIRKNKENTYSFLVNTNELTIKLPNKEDVVGIFSFRNLILTMNYNDIEEAYTVSPMSPNFVRVMKDMTKEYQALYPTKGISKVQIVEYWQMFTL